MTYRISKFEPNILIHGMIYLIYSLVCHHHANLSSRSDHANESRGSTWREIALN